MITSVLRRSVGKFLSVTKKVCVTRKEHFLKLCQGQKSFYIFVNMFEEHYLPKVLAAPILSQLWPSLIKLSPGSRLVL